MTARAGRARGERALGGRVVRLGVALSIAFGGVALGAGYWQVLRADDLSHDPSDAGVIAATQNAVRGRILDRDGHVLASNRRGPGGVLYRVYADPSLSAPLGYASSLYGSAGLEAADASELLGFGGDDPLARALAKFRPPSPRGDDLRTSLSLTLQELAVRLLGGDRGAVVALDPRTGDVLALVSTPTFDASGIANPATARSAFTAALDDPGQPLLDRATQGRYVPGSAFKIVTAIAGFASGAIDAGTTFPQQPGDETTGLLVDGFRVVDGHHLFTGSEVLDFSRATEVSCNIWYALAGLRIGGAGMTAAARRLGFDAPIPFDLPTAISQLTNGGGPLPGGFADDVELANAAYGQGEVLVTPLQMALVAATVADGGVEPRPRLVTAVVSPSGAVSSVPAGTLGRVLEAQDAATIAGAMVQAVEGVDGQKFTAGAQVAGVTVAGKTGTAQLGGSGEPNSWFIGFAPAEAPTIALAVIVEHGGSGGARAAPLAGDLLRAYFAAQP